MTNTPPPRVVLILAIRALFFVSSRAATTYQDTMADAASMSHALALNLSSYVSARHFSSRVLLSNVTCSIMLHGRHFRRRHHKVWGYELKLRRIVTSCDHRDLEVSDSRMNAFDLRAD